MSRFAFMQRTSFNLCCLIFFILMLIVFVATSKDLGRSICITTLFLNVVIFGFRTYASLCADEISPKQVLLAKSLTIKLCDHIVGTDPSPERIGESLANKLLSIYDWDTLVVDARRTNPKYLVSSTIYAMSLHVFKTDHIRWRNLPRITWQTDHDFQVDIIKGWLEDRSHLLTSSSNQ